MDISVHVKIAVPEVSFDQRFVLLRVPAGEDEVTLRGNEPVEFLEPVDFAMMVLE